jgi:DNA-binding winged helix-turn-helix (wHTH) protein/TolB-like protein/Flp pilus assembly protein TadD
MLQFGEFVLDTRQRRLLRLPGREPIPLSSKVFDTLQYFAEHPNVVLEKDTLLQAIWPGVIVEENSLTQNVSTLRQVLGDAPGEHRYIVTVPRRGYRFVAEVTEATMPAAHPARAPSLSLNPGEPAPLFPDARGRAIAWRWGAVAVALAVVAIAVLFAVLLTGRTPPDADSQQLAVLPFKPLAISDRDESLELGMADSLIARLSAQQKLVVRPLSSVRRFSAPDQDPLTAGRALGVASVLDGSLQHSDRRIRVSARLLRVADGRQLWAQSFDEDVTTIFEMQDAIAARVSEALVLKLSAQPRGETRDSEAYLLYANGRLAWSRFTEASLLQAIDYFEKAIARDERYAMAYVGLADSYAILGVFGVRAPREVFPRARSAVERALELDPDSAAAHTTLGHIKIQYDLDWRGGLAEYARAIDLDPNYAPVYHYRGLVYARQGETDRAIEQLKRAQQLEPLWVAPRAALGMVLAYARRHEEAIAQLTQTLALDERADNARTYLGRAYMYSGQYERALVEFRRRQAQAPGSYADVAQALALSGRQKEAREELARLLSLSTERYVPALDIATVYASLGEKENAMEWLERAFADRSTNLGFLAQDPAFDKLHEDSRFVALVARVGVSKQRR